MVFSGPFDKGLQEFYVLLHGLGVQSFLGVHLWIQKTTV